MRTWGAAVLRPYIFVGDCSAVAAVGVVFAPGALGQRKPVLKQIELPHPYYYREMYLPELTSVPSSVAWSPDSREVIYSMAGRCGGRGSIRIRRSRLTDGAGYDYQPDWSADGKTVVYVSYQHDAMELWVLDLATGKSRQIDARGRGECGAAVVAGWEDDCVCVDGVHGRFHIFVMDTGDGFAEGKANVVRLTEETKSTLPRYYYAEYDTEIHPIVVA